jgi:hypothetical protein
MTQPKSMSTKTRKPSKNTKPSQGRESPKANKLRKSGDIELTEEALNKVTGGTRRSGGGGSTIF